ncbi:MAG TPA: glycosyltransferase family 4 protein [Clostridiaceae bacterium]|jgi:hypothetical protein|nr:glycosyltransferase family 4 protein [Clostridiaceae bacterium]
MKVAILTMFLRLDTTYSLVNIVAEQLKMLLDAGISTKLLVCEQFDENSKYGIYLDNRIEWEKVVNTYNGRQIRWYDYSQPKGKVHESFFQEAEIISEDLVKKLSGVDVCIMHDILYQGWHLLHNVAIRKAQEKLENIRFVSFSHSVPVNRPKNPKWPFSARYTPMPDTIYVALTYSAINALAKQYDVPEGRCRVVYNSLDLLADLSEDVKTISREIDILSPDILTVYAGRLTPGKKFDKVAAFAGAIKRKTEKTVKVVFCDFPCMDVDANTYKTSVRLTGKHFGLDGEDMVFTTDLGYPNGFPRKGVLDLFTLSNLYVSPSYSESFSLTLLEAASRGNFLVLNQAVPALEEIGKQLNAYFMRWDARNYGYDTKEKYYPSEQAYYEEHGEIVVNLMRENPVIRAKTLVRQRYSPQWVWKNQLEPLLS